MTEIYIPKVFTEKFIVLDDGKFTCLQRTIEAILVLQEEINRNGFLCEIEFIGTQYMSSCDAVDFIDKAFIDETLFVYKFTLNTNNMFYVQACYFHGYVKKHHGLTDKMYINGKNYNINGKIYETELNKILNKAKHDIQTNN